MAEMARLKSIAKPLSWLALGVLALDFWAPRAWLHWLHLTGFHFQTALCAAVMLCLVEVYGFEPTPRRLEHYGLHYHPQAPDWNGVTRNVLRITVAFLIYAAILEVGQKYFGRHADIKDYFVNVAAVVATVSALLPMKRRRSPRPAWSRR